MASKQQTHTYAAQSTFVFTGKVIKLKAATLDGINTDNTAVVQVDHVVTAPPAFAGLSGQQVTVRFKSMAGITKGSSHTFFTNGWVYGSSLALDAVGTVKETEKKAMASMVQEGKTSESDSVLKSRLDSAAMAVVGVVSKVEPTAIETTHISEHDADWHEATIDVHEMMKGKKGTKSVKVLFPKSDDVLWFRSKKFTEGQQGIWLLQRGKKPAKGITPKVLAAVPEGADVMTSLHPADFLPLDELGRVKSLLKS